VEEGRVMTSFLVELMARKGTLLPDRAGLHWCRAGLHEWVRWPDEPEAAFWARTRLEAKALGFRVLTFGGAVPLYDIYTDNVVSLSLTQPKRSTNARKHTEDAER
jgi:hypothetical protein